MKRKVTIVISCVVCVMLAWNIGWGEETKKEEKKQIEELVLKPQIPIINEIFKQAKKSGIVGDWDKRSKLDNIAYDKITDEPGRAFEVGKTLASVAIRVLDKGKSDEIDDNLLKEAKSAIMSLKPSADIATEIEEIYGGVKAKSLKGEELRKKLDTFIGKVIPQLEKYPKTKDAGTLVWASGFCRAMYLGTSTVAGYENPTPEQLALFRYGSMIDYFIEYFSKDAGDSFKTHEIVKSLVITLKKVKVSVDKIPQEVKKEDIVKMKEEVKNISNALKSQFE